MLLAEDRLDVLVDRLAGVTPEDRRAVLAKLTRAERLRVAALLKTPNAVAALPFSPDLAARIADDAGTLTPAARAALARAVTRRQPGAASTTTAATPTSLVGAIGRWLSSGR